jgi:hypothetical protein
VASVVVAIAVSANASQRTFVSGAGSDANPCSFAAPCRSFTAAIAQTDASGEIVVLDSAGYGPVVIDKSVAIIAPLGIFAGIAAGSGQNGVDINGVGIDVTLRGLTISGQFSSIGINIVEASHVYVDNCVVSHTGGNAGIGVALPPGSPGKVRIVGSRLAVNNSGIRVSGGNVTVVDSSIDGSAQPGVDVQGGRVSVQRSSLSGGANSGLSVHTSSQSAFAVVSDSVLSGNATHGLVASSTASGAVRLIGYANAITDTNPSCGVCSGVDSYAEATSSTLVAMARNVVTRSGGRGWYAIALVNFYTYGDNLLNDNAGGSKIGSFINAAYQ